MEQSKLIAKQILQQKQKIMELMGNRTSGFFKKHSNVEHYQYFNLHEYPFDKKLQNPPKQLKSMVPCSTLDPYLEIIISLSHPNIVQIERVSKCSNKGHHEKLLESHYALYYEVVPYSLKKLSQSSKIVTVSFSLPTSQELCQKLADVSEYLIERDIWVKVRLDDIGITEQGTIKIFVSPLEIITSDKNQGKKNQIMINIDQIVGWWSSIRASRGSSRREKDDGQISNSLGFEKEEKKVQKQKITSSFIEKYRRNSGNEQKPQSRPGSPNKMQNLTEQLREIKQIMNEKFKNWFSKEHESPKPQIKEKQCLKQKKQESEKKDSHQSILQNINCINIFNNHLSTHPMEASTGRKKKVNLQSQNIFSMKIEGGQQQKHQQKSGKKNQLFHLNSSPEDCHPLEQEDNLSVDTYDMDFGEQFLQIPPTPTDPFRRSLKVPKRQYSQLHPDLEAGKKQTNEVISPNKVTESAGPRQFKKFVIQHIKPQFLAKKSNIYEDPDQYESDKSYGELKKLPPGIKELTEAGKSAASYNENSSSAKKSKEKEVENFGQNKNEKVMKNSRGPLETRKRQDSSHIEMKASSEEKIMKNQRSQAVISSKIYQKEMEDRVKAVLQKTKNALALLSKAKEIKNTVKKH